MIGTKLLGRYYRIIKINEMSKQFLKEKVLDEFPTICAEMFDKHAPKRREIYNLTMGLSLIMKFLRQS